MVEKAEGRRSSLLLAGGRGRVGRSGLNNEEGRRGGGQRSRVGPGRHIRARAHRQPAPITAPGRLHCLGARRPPFQAFTSLRSRSQASTAWLHALHCRCRPAQRERPAALGWCARARLPAAGHARPRLTYVAGSTSQRGHASQQRRCDLPIAPPPDMDRLTEAASQQGQHSLDAAYETRSPAHSRSLPCPGPRPAERPVLHGNRCFFLYPRRQLVELCFQIAAGTAGPAGSVECIGRVETIYKLKCAARLLETGVEPWEMSHALPGLAFAFCII